MAVKKVFILNQTTPVNIPSGLVPKGAYVAGTDYAVGDSVDYNGSSYVMFVDAAAGTLPTDTTKWQVLANGGVRSVNTKTGVVVIDPDDLDDTATTNKFVTAADKVILGNTSGTNSGDNAANTSIAATKLDDFATPDNNTDLNANTTNHGLLLQATAPAANELNVVGIANGETVYANKDLFNTTNPAALGSVGSGTAIQASRSDHIHANPAIDTLAAATNITTLDSSTTAHGLLIKATAPAAGLTNVVAIENGETVYKNKALFDATDPSTQAYGDAAAVGSAVVAARRDHKHAMMAAPTIPVKATGAELSTGTDDAKFATAAALKSAGINSWLANQVYN